MGRRNEEGTSGPIARAEEARTIAAFGVDGNKSGPGAHIKVVLRSACVLSSRHLVESDDVRCIGHEP